MPVWLGRRFPPDQLVSGGTWPQLPGQSSGCEDKLCLWVRVATFCPLLLLLLPPPPPPPPVLPVLRPPLSALLPPLPRILRQGNTVWRGQMGAARA